MIELRYLLGGVGYVSRETVKKIINDPQIKFSGFKRYQSGYPGASSIIIISGKTHQLDIHYIDKEAFSTRNKVESQ